MLNQTWVCYTDNVPGRMMSIQLRRTEPMLVDSSQRCPPLPAGCLVEIFKYLDCYRSLVRCSSVCKEWQSAAADAGLISRVCLKPDSRPHSRQRLTRSAEAAAVLARLSQQNVRDLEIGTCHTRCVPLDKPTSVSLCTARLHIRDLNVDKPDEPRVSIQLSCS